MDWASSPTTVRPLPPGQSICEDLGLQDVGVLVLVDQHAVEAAPDGAGGPGVGEQAVPEEQQVVVVEDALLAFAVHVGVEEPAEFFDLVLAPGEVRPRRPLPASRGR